DRDLEPDLVRDLDHHGAAAIRLDAVELASVALDPAHRDPADLSPIQGLEYVIRPLRPDDADHKLHDVPLSGTRTATAGLAARTYTKRRARRSADIRAVHQQPHGGVTRHDMSRRRLRAAHVPVRGEQHPEQAVAFLAVPEAEIVETPLGDIEGLPGQIRDGDAGRLRWRAAATVGESRHLDRGGHAQAADHDQGGKGGQE